MKKTVLALLGTSFLAFAPAQAQDARLERLKTEAATKIDARAKLVQEIIDQVFSFGELGMQEIETSKYLTGLLEKNASCHVYACVFTMLFASFRLFFFLVVPVTLRL
jgi:aminobenzoyl-glutamate utilization protein B